LEGRIFNKYEIENNITNILTFYENNGYPFIKVVIQAVTFSPDNSSGKYYADVRLKIE